jgi:hypothetical protein
MLFPVSDYVFNNFTLTVSIKLKRPPVPFFIILEKADIFQKTLQLTRNIIKLQRKRIETNTIIINFSSYCKLYRYYQHVQFSR